MSDKGEGSGVFTVAILNDLRDRFSKLPEPLQRAVKSMLTGAVTDPVAARVAFVEGQQLISGLAKVDQQLYYVRLRFVYDPTKHLIILAEMAEPLLVQGPH
jgi:hypothetical protein